MARKLKPATYDDAMRVRRAITDLKLVRDELKLAECPEAAKAVRLAIKSAEGALRHVWRRIAAAQMAAP